MKKIFTVAATTLLLMASSAHAQAVKSEAKIEAKTHEKTQAQKVKQPVVGEVAPEIVSKTIKGDDFSLVAQKGKLVVLEWTNPDCPFVKKHYDSNNMQALQKKYTALVNDKKENEIIWVSILSSARGKQGFQSSNEEAIKTFEAMKSSASHIILDGEGLIGKAYAAKTTPAMFVIDRDGKLAYSGAIDTIASADQSDIKKSENLVAKALDELLAGKKITAPVTESYGCSVKY